MVLDNFVTLIGAVTAANGLTGQLVTSIGVTKGVNTYDLAPPGLLSSQVPDFSRSDVQLSLNILQTLSSAGAATVRVALITADDAALSSNVQVIKQTDDIPFALLTAGKVVNMTVGGAALVKRRYLGAQITVGGAPLTNAVGQFFGSVSLDVATSPTAYRSGYAIV